MRFIAWFDVSWKDEFLILPDDVESLLILKEDIWYPDLSIYDSVEDPQTISDGKHVILFKNGRVSWYPGNEYVIRCNIDIRRYPFDGQHCHLRVGAWHTTAWTQRLVESGNGVDISNYVENGEWEITSTSMESKKSFGYNTSWIRYHVYLKRRPLHPVLNTLAPIVMLSFLNTLVFLLPANSGEKMTLCISVLLSFTVFLTVFNDTMPKMSTTISYLSVYLVVQLGMSLFAIVMSIYVWRIKDRQADFVNMSNNDTDEEGRHVHSNNDNLNGHLMPLHFSGYKDGNDGQCPDVGETKSKLGCQRDETEVTLSTNSNEFARKSTLRSTSFRAKNFPSSNEHGTVDLDKAYKSSLNIEKLDMAMFLITFFVVIISTVLLFVSLLV
ncbi:neuronal acetylcholine receptor subunit alpha-3-like [Argopecten irradians]|uniref:neuronal acetylcholine receptor subunit alpha-3-like n=1 Tax=Argopecten irradians TaxID=31199 RepID=UPI003713794A